MLQMEALRPLMSEVTSVQVQADGYALWLVWQGEVNPVVLQTLEEYGGMLVLEEKNQALWFFFSTEALLAAARLGVWARFNTLALLIALFPARMLAEQGGAKKLIFDEALWKQTVAPPKDFTITVHSALAGVVETAPGLSLGPIDAGKGMDPGIWSVLEIDGRLPYQSPLNWYVMLRPVGNVQDKNFIVGWREFLSQLESVLQRNKIRFTLHELFLLFPLDSLRQLKQWCYDSLSLLNRLRLEMPEAYWPCISAIVDRKGLNLNEELPQKSGVAWEQLNPDFPHMTMRNALLLGKDFVAHEAGFARATRSPEDWASVSLRGEDGDVTALPRLVPVNLVQGTFPYCFYCGQHSHASADCPSHGIAEVDAGVWRSVAQLNLEDMIAGVRRIDDELSPEKIPPDSGETKNGRITALLREDGSHALMLSAFFAGNWVCQRRAINIFWRAHGKDFQKFAMDLAPVDTSPAWTLLDEFNAGAGPELDKTLESTAMRFHRDFRLPSLRGFLAAERGDFDKAEHYWKEAQVVSSSPIVQAWHVFLQARALECKGRFTEAGTHYEQVLRIVSNWFDADYRKAACMIKGGFSEAALPLLTAQIGRNGHVFNRVLVDPELERGNIQVNVTLSGLWTSMEARAREEQLLLQKAQDELATWFVPGHEFAVQLAGRIQKLMQLGAIRNYVAFQSLAKGRVQLEKDMQTYVAKEAREYKIRFKSFITRLKTIHDESAWFPFPSALADFNRSYNEGVANLNWALKSNFHTPEAFRKAQQLVENESERIAKLESRLKFLCIVRDATLFILSVAEWFFWMEVVCILFIFVLLPLVLVYGDKIGLDFAANLISAERWTVQKGLFIVVTVLAAGIATLRAILRFETIRDKVLTKAKTGVLKRAKAK